MMRVTIARRHFYFHKIEVEQAMNGVAPEPVTGASVEIGGVSYPIMQVGAVLTRQDRRDFNSGEVVRAMQALAFPCRMTPAAHPTTDGTEATAPSATSATSATSSTSATSTPTSSD
jgi:hypothetical protein